MAASTEAKNNGTESSNTRKTESYKENIEKINDVKTPQENIASAPTETATEIKLAPSDDTQNYDFNSETEDEKFSTIKRTPQSNKIAENEVVKVDEIAAIDVIAPPNNEGNVYLLNKYKNI